MTKKLILTLLAIFLLINVFFLPNTSMAKSVSTSDLWDVNNGAVIDATSGPLYYSSSYRSYVENIFGASGGIAGSYTLFKDYNSPYYSGGSVSAGYIHYVEWHTPNPITLRSFNLVAYNEGMNKRAFDHFELLADVGGVWQTIYEQDFAASPGNPYGYGGSPTYDTATNWLELEVDLLNSVDAQNFRAEFQQASWTDSRAIGPRVWELDGYDTFLDGTTDTNPVPVPATMLLLGSGLIGLVGFRKKFKK